MPRPRAPWNIKQLTQGTHCTRCSSAFFSLASLFSTARMSSCSSSVRKLRSIMMTAAALQLSTALSVWLVAEHDQCFTRFFLKLPKALFCSHKLAVAVVYTHRIISINSTEWSYWECNYYLFWSSGDLIVLDMFCFSWVCFCSHVWHFVDQLESERIQQKFHEFWGTWERFSHNITWFSLQQTSESEWYV